MPSINPRLLPWLQNLNKYVNPWHPTGNLALDAGKSLGAAGVAAIPLTAGINSGVYGGMMGRHYTGPDGKEVAGLDPTSKFTEYMSNMALSLPFLNPRMFKHMYPTLGTYLAAKGLITLAIPSITDISKSTQNANKATEEAAKAMTNVSGVAESLKEAPGALREAMKAMQANRDWATPFVTGGIGAAAGNLAGRFFENEGKVTTAEKNKQKRNRILLTLLGAGGGALVGSRSSQGLPPLMPTGDEWKNIAGTVQGGVNSVKDWAAGLGKQANEFDPRTASITAPLLMQALKARIAAGEQGGPNGDTALALHQIQNPGEHIDNGGRDYPTFRLLAAPAGGAVAGAGIGALIQHLRGHGKREKDKPSLGTGALLGGVLGGLAGAADAPRQMYNSSEFGRGFGTVSFMDGLRGLGRLATGPNRDNVIPETLSKALLDKWDKKANTQPAADRFNIPEPRNAQLWKSWFNNGADQSFWGKLLNGGQSQHYDSIDRGDTPGWMVPISQALQTARAVIKPQLSPLVNIPATLGTAGLRLQHNKNLQPLLAERQRIFNAHVPTGVTAPILPTPYRPGANILPQAVMPAPLGAPSPQW